MPEKRELKPSFITRWLDSGGSEQANAQLFLSELCSFLDVPTPDPAGPETEENAYTFERKVIFHHSDGTTSFGRIDLYRRGAFVLEAKQGQDEVDDPNGIKRIIKKSKQTSSSAVKRNTRKWVEAMEKAKRQAEGYVRSLPATEGRPPFIIVVDVGYCLDIYAEFSCTGGSYTSFPDVRSHRIHLEELVNKEVQDFLRKIWLAPLSLDPGRRAAKVTREIASHLATLARSLEKSGFPPDEVAVFLMRCLFSMFSEDVGLLPPDSFTRILEDGIAEPTGFQPTVEEMWNKMNTGGWSIALKSSLLRFNGGLFEKPEVLPLGKDQISVLLQAARADWKEVEPAIFGTLLERALDPRERHKLGAHYTPRAYVERLVMPTVINPLRDEWEGVQAAASMLADKNKWREAHSVIFEFYKRLCSTLVLDPACGSGNFLYVTLEHFKRLEGEVLALMEKYGERQTMLAAKFVTVDPHQFLGIEVNPRAAIIAELVLWIGYLQWHFRTHGDIYPPQPVIKKFQNIECRDALMNWDRLEVDLDDDGNPITRWDGHAMREDPATGRMIPDESFRQEELVYINPVEAQWPKADYIVGNPPFIGGGHKRANLGNGYFKALKTVFPELPESCDYVMYWWDKAASLVRQGKVKRFGFITTNSLRQTFNRRVTSRHLDDTLSLVFAVPDHPWVDSADGAAVRIAMTVGQKGNAFGCLSKVMKEDKTDGPEQEVTLNVAYGRIHSDLSMGADVSSAKPLKANKHISCPGVKLHGAGFIVTPEEAKELGLGRIPDLEKHIRHYRNGRDLTQSPRGVMVIDLYGLSDSDTRSKFPEVYQWIKDRVKPQRIARKMNSKDSEQYAAKWWLFGKPRETFRPALSELNRYIATVETSKHRFFTFLDTAILPDNMLINIAIEDAFALGVLSSRIHVTWALALGGRLGVGNDPRYNKTRCFETFPFPDATAAHKTRIRELGEALDAHRKERQRLHSDLTMTGMYNVLEKVKTGETLTDKDKDIHSKGLISILHEIHQKLDATVFEAYGWPDSITKAEILENLLMLNAERKAEEEIGYLRWLRPDYQAKDKPQKRPAKARKTGRKAAQRKVEKQPWPKPLSEKINAVRLVLASQGKPANVENIALHFNNAPRRKVKEVLDTLTNLGFALETEGDTYISS